MRWIIAFGLVLALLTLSSLLAGVSTASLSYSQSIPFNGTMNPTPTPTPTATPTPSPSPTPTPTPTPTPSPTPTPAPQSGALWLHTSGTELYDSNGHQLRLHALNILVDQSWSSTAIITNATISQIKSYGFNAIRLHLEWYRMQPTSSSSVDTTFFTGNNNNMGASLDNIVQWCNQNGIYVILNLHWGGGSTPPSWVPNTGYGCDTGDGSAWLVDIFGDTPNNPSVSANIRAGISYLYNFMASRYASNPSVIFEGINELLAPNSDTDAGTPFANFNNQWISAIESGEGSYSHIKIVEVLIDTDWNVLWTAPYVSGTHANIMLATHDYSPMTGWTGSSSQITTLQNRIASQETKAHAAGYPIIDTEFSKSQDQTAFASFFNTELTAFANDDYQGWAYWCYCGDPTINSSGSSNWNIYKSTVQANILPILQVYMKQPGD